jgi:hypothetical protein
MPDGIVAEGKGNGAAVFADAPFLGQGRNRRARFIETNQPIEKKAADFLIDQIAIAQERVEIPGCADDALDQAATSGGHACAAEPGRLYLN